MSTYLYSPWTSKHKGVRRVGPRSFPGASTQIPRVDTEVYGRLWAPSDLQEFAAVVQYVTSGIDVTVHGWRGQANISWRLDSGAIRRLDWEPGLVNLGAGVRDVVKLRTALELYEQELLNQARLGGHDMAEYGRRLTDFQLLAALQHYGAATRLLDFTLNAYTALWFASYGRPQDLYGVLIGIISDFGASPDPDADLPIHIRSDALEKSITEAIAAHPGQIQLWRPHVGYDRMLAQQSLLAFGTLTDNPWGSFGFLRTDSDTTLSFAPELTTVGRDLVAIALPPRLKSMVREHAADLFGYSPATLFPDLAGFSQWQSSGQEIDTDMRDRLWSAVPGAK